MKIEYYFRTKRRDPLLRKIAGICRELGYGIDMEETMLHIYPCPLAELAIGWRRKNILLSSQWELAGGCDTSQAGPGLHKAVAELLDRIGQENVTNLTVDDSTGYWEHRDFRRLKDEAFRLWLEKQRGQKQEFLCWDLDVYQPEHIPDTIVTSLGRFTRKELEQVDADRFFLWPGPGKDALYYRNRALYDLWTSCHYTPDDPVNESILDNLEKAHWADPELPLPLSAYRELCIVSGHEFQISEDAPELEERYSPGYRKGMVRNRIGSLRFLLPGSYRFEVERLENGSLGSLWQDESIESPQWRVSGFLRESGQNAEYAADFSAMQEVEQISLQNGEARMGWTGDQITCEAVIGPGLYVLNVTYHTPEEREESRALLRQIESCL